MPGKLKQHWQRGDTIVEVMVVLAILGLAIGISYATANRSLLNARQAQENSYATGLAQTQVERLSAQSNNPLLYSQPGEFCINSSPSPIVVATDSSCKPSAAGGSYTYTITDVDCTVHNSDALCGTTETWGADTFVVQVTWPDVLGAGNGNDTVTLSYRVHQPQL